MMGEISECGWERPHTDRRGKRHADVGNLLPPSPPSSFPYISLFRCFTSSPSPLVSSLYPIHRSRRSVYSSFTVSGLAAPLRLVLTAFGVSSSTTTASLQEAALQPCVPPGGVSSSLVSLPLFSSSASPRLTLLSGEERLASPRHLLPLNPPAVPSSPPWPPASRAPREQGRGWEG